MTRSAATGRVWHGTARALWRGLLNVLGRPRVIPWRLSVVVVCLCIAEVGLGLLPTPTPPPSVQIKGYSYDTNGRAGRVTHVDSPGSSMTVSFDDGTSVTREDYLRYVYHSPSLRLGAPVRFEAYLPDYGHLVGTDVVQHGGGNVPQPD